MKTIALSLAFCLPRFQPVSLSLYTRSTYNHRRRWNFIPSSESTFQSFHTNDSQHSHPCKKWHKQKWENNSAKEREREKNMLLVCVCVLWTTIWKCETLRSRLNECVCVCRFGRFYFGVAESPCEWRMKDILVRWRSWIQLSACLRHRSPISTIGYMLGSARAADVMKRIAFRFCFGWCECATSTVQYLDRNYEFTFRIGSDWIGVVQ